MIDSHCHLQYDFAPKSAADLVSEAKSQGVTHLVTIGTDVPSSHEARKLADQHPEVYFSAGIHPHEAMEWNDAIEKELRALAAHKKCVAIGELGLDYYYKHSPPEKQIMVLDQQLRMAKDLQLPVVVHSRDAENDLWNSLENYAKNWSAPYSPGVIHCFTGTQEFGQKCLDLGFYISFSGILTFKNAEDLRKAAQAFPLERLLIETDSPYLAPIPHRGKKCEPSMVKWTAMKLAEIKSIDLEQLVQITRRNTQSLFRGIAISQGA